jgi:hypothetical protein
MGASLGCTPSKAPEPGADKSLVGQASDAQSAPLLNKFEYKGDDLPIGSLKEFELMFDASEDEQAKAEIVISWPLEEAPAEDSGESVGVDPLAVQRRDMLMRLSRAGLKYASMKSADGDEAFIIIQATEERLMECAEITNFEMRLKKSWQVPYAPFTIDRKDDFVWENKAEGKIFSTRDRQTLIMRIMETGDFSTVDEMNVSSYENMIWKNKYNQNKLPTCGLNLDSYVSSGVLNGYWAMHGTGRRQELMQRWAAIGKAWRQQPLKIIFEYFNSKTALYFAFTGYYTSWLAVSCLFGVAVQVWDTLHSVEKGRNEDDGNIMTCYFAFFMALWGTFFLEFWKRYNAELAYRWSTTGLEQEAAERVEFRRGTAGMVRQGFYASNGRFVPYDDDLEPTGFCNNLCACGMSFNDDVDEDVDHTTKQRITQFAPPDVPYMDQGTRMNRICINWGVAFMFTISVLAILMSFLVMRLIFQKMIDASMGAMLASTLQALVTVGLNVIYKEIAICMVDYENYRTDTEWEDAIVNKVFAFQFINSYFSLFYIAFMKGRIGHLAGYSDQCKNASTGKPTDNCMGELYTLLLSTLLTTQIVSTIGEALLPYFQYKAVMWAEQAKWKAEGNDGPLNLSEIDHESKLTPAYKLDAFNDYNKMALQSGYVSMFVAAFPLAPLCALLNNILEIRTDAMKRVYAMQRPAPSERAEHIGAWMYILELMNVAAVATNMGVLCFTSNQLAEVYKLDATQRVWAFVILEHIIILIKLFLSSCINDVPEWVELRLARDLYMLRSREEIVVGEQEALEKSQQTLHAIGGVTLETDGAKAPMTSSGVGNIGTSGNLRGGE